MSGYLQRLACSVMQPRTRIHALVGSVFSRPQRTEPETVPPPSPAFSSDEPASIGGEGQQQLLMSKSSRQSNREISDTFPGVKSDPIPQFLRRAAEFVEHPDEDQDFTSARPLAERRSVGDFATIHETGEKEQKTDYAPLVTVTARGSQPKSQPPASSIPFAPATQVPQKPQAPAAAASHEPDEIQIHIGKIEVLAVPQAPPARIASASRKAMSLEEYLRKRDRSTR